MALIASFGLASVAVISTVNVQQSTKRDHSSKEAIAAADAGANIAMLRLNRFAKGFTVGYRCIGPNGEAQTPSATGWCPVSPTESTGGATYHYEVSAYSPTGTGVQVVSTGTSGEVTRRVDVALTLHQEEGVFKDEGLIGEEKINVEDAAATIEANLGTNGIVSGNRNSYICPPETERVGPGEEGKSLQPDCGRLIAGVKKLPLVAPPTDIATNNSNCRLAAAAKPGTGACPKEADTFGSESGNKGGFTFTETGGRAELTVSNKNGSLTMGGKRYWLCKLMLSSGKIYMAAKTEVQIFIRTPEECGYPSGEAQFEIGPGGKTSVVCTSCEETGVLPAIYMLGDGSVRMQGNPESFQLMLYAPLANVDLGGNPTWTGTIAAREINIHGKITFHSFQPSEAQDPKYEPLMARSRYVECGGGAPAPGTGPNANC
jgi:hypothetical protein